jgi:transcriptional regulator with XRE-family HTH domain
MINREEIKRRREAIGLTLDEAAKRAGFGQRQRWYAIESGRGSNLAAESLYAVAGVLGCTMEDLMIRPMPKKRTTKKGR